MDFWVFSMMKLGAMALFAVSVCYAIPVNAGKQFVSRCEPVDEKAVAKCYVRTGDSTELTRITVRKSERHDSRKVTRWQFGTQNESTSTVILVDGSDKISPSLQNIIREEIESIFFPAIRPNRKFGLASFAVDTEIIVPPTSDRQQLSDALKTMQRRSSSHELYRAALDAIRSLKNESADLKFLVIVSNGKTRDSAYRRSDVVKLAKDENIRIFTLGFLQSAKGSPQLQSMRRLAEETGGFFAKANLSDKRLPIDFRARFLQAIEGETGISFEADRTGENQEFLIEAALKSGETATGKLLIPGSEAAKVRFKYAFLTLSNPYVSGTILFLVVAAGGIMAWFRFKTPSAKINSGPVDDLNSETPNKHNPGPQPQTKGRQAEKKLTEDLAVRLEGASLEVIGHESDPRAIDKPKLRIGRSETSDLHLADPTVHRHHAIIRVTDKGRFTIEDISGENGNGVYINDEKIAQADLFHDDVIELGNVLLRFDHEIQETTVEDRPREKIAV